MATFYVDNRLTTGTNAGTSLANAWRSLYDVQAGIGVVNPGDTIQFASGSGPYRECIWASSETVATTDISFAAGSPARILSTANNLAAFTSGQIVRVSDVSGVNSGQYTSAGVTGVGPYTLTLNSTNQVTTQAAGNRVILSLVSSSSAVAMLLGKNGTAADNIYWDLNGCEVSAGLDVMTSAYQWTASAAGTNEYYLTRANGTNPSLNRVVVAVVNGNYLTASAETAHQIGTVSSLADGFLGWGNADALGFSTIYVRSNSGNPAAVGMTVVIGQVAAVLDTNWGYHTVKNGTLSFGMLIEGAGYGATVRCRGLSWTFPNVKFAYAQNHAVESAASGPVTLDHCLSYWSGHRLVAVTGDVTTNVYNCGDYGSHLFALINGGLTSAAVLNIYNCWSTNNEAGAIDKASAAAILNEGGNCWYPRMTAAGGALGYVSTANWTTTAASDYPPSAATTIATRANILSAGGVDPTFVATSDISLSACDFNLGNASALFRKGVSGKGFLYKSIGETAAHSAVNPNIGPYATRDGDVSSQRTNR